MHAFQEIFFTVSPWKGTHSTQKTVGGVVLPKPSVCHKANSCYLQWKWTYWQPKKQCCLSPLNLQLLPAVWSWREGWGDPEEYWEDRLQISYHTPWGWGGGRWGGRETDEGSGGAKWEWTGGQTWPARGHPHRGEFIMVLFQRWEGRLLWTKGFYLFLCVCQGYIDAGAEQCLCVLYLPGIPEVFEKRFQLHVAFLLPQDITVTGEGVFPRIGLNLPQNLCMHRRALIHTDMIVSLLCMPKDENLQCNIQVCYVLLCFSYCLFRQNSSKQKVLTM